MSWRDIVKAKELTPKQKKIDTNHNGVIDAQDFHIMNGSEKKSCGENCNCSSCGETEHPNMYKSPSKKHYTKNGKEWTGKTHKTQGKLMTGETHTDDSVDLFHREELPKSRSAFTRRD